MNSDFWKVIYGTNVTVKLFIDFVDTTLFFQTVDANNREVLCWFEFTDDQIQEFLDCWKSLHIKRKMSYTCSSTDVTGEFTLQGDCVLLRVTYPDPCSKDEPNSFDAMVDQQKLASLVEYMGQPIPE